MLQGGAQRMAQRQVNEGGFGDDFEDIVSGSESYTKKSDESSKSSSSENNFDGIHHRTNFLETLFSEHGIITDKTGVATFSFKTSDSITSYRILLEALHYQTEEPIEKNGFNMFSDFSKLLVCKNKFYVEPKLPSFVVEDDRLNVPISYIYNENDRIKIESQLEHSKEISSDKSADLLFPFHLEKQEKTRKIVSLKIGDIEVRKTLNLTLKALALSSDKKTIGDIVTREFIATPRGFPQNSFFSGTLNSENTLSFDLFLPKDSFRVSTSNSKIFPKPTSTLISAIDTLIQQPCGKFLIFYFYFYFFFYFLQIRMF
jgi:hypothetical protein